MSLQSRCKSKGHNKFGIMIRPLEGRVLGLHGGGTDNVLSVRSRITTVRVSSENM
jgi:hypothetical protein